MRRPSKKNSGSKLSADSQRLTTFSQAIDQAASRLEERYWENQLDALLHKLLRNQHQDAIDAALDNLFKQESGAYDALMESVEAAAESCTIEHDDTQYDVLLIAMPILAWTRFSIASGPLPADMATTLSAHLHAHVLAADVKIAMSPMLFSIDQLPRTHADTFALTQQMGLAALKDTALKSPVRQPETAPFLADTRYLLAAIAAPAGAPLFRWQASADPAERDQALAQWNAQALPNVARLLPGCGIELLLPEAYFVACREGDRLIRPASIRAAVHYLTHTLEIEPAALQAVIGSFGEEENNGRVDEYRISFGLAGDDDVLYGVVWPLYGQEDDDEAYRVAPSPASAASTASASEPAFRKTPTEEIVGLLEECGIIRIKRLAELFSMEFCDDCGSPLFPDVNADLVHAEMPEDAPAGNPHLH
ncbi:DUF2863 family protein [Oxalicibacterium solurbis]|uniref:DUF2863 family protein n=1 Tax=Oxalicibacterium solurbis TaxID=69280 RepID=A0A8J3B155_9BURK|nr:DUF2863 family protein [Oxalicibacterium solurbis]GGI52979.1 hypothetical protein GCM10011430_01530 [Oxalicibacterium solurbis]